MKSKASCPKCGSARILQQVQVLDRSDSGAQSLSLRRGTRALGGWLKLPRSFPLDAWVCGACGYTELYVRAPAELLAAEQENAPSAIGMTGQPGQAGMPSSDQARRILILALLVAMVIGAGVLAALALFLGR